MAKPDKTYSHDGVEYTDFNDYLDAACPGWDDVDEEAEAEYEKYLASDEFEARANWEAEMPSNGASDSEMDDWWNKRP